MPHIITTKKHPYGFYTGFNVKGRRPIEFNIKKYYVENEEVQKYFGTFKSFLIWISRNDNTFKGDEKHLQKLLKKRKKQIKARGW